MTVKTLYADVICDNRGPFLRFGTLIVTGLSPSSANTIPHGLGNTLRSVTLQAIANNSAVTAANLDDSQGDADSTGTLAGGHLGWDKTNIYVMMGTGSELEIRYEY